MNPPVFLFDLDGVLVAPRGYRAAVQAALRHTLNRWGWPLRLPEDLPDLFEAVGISSEWDMLPLILGTLLDAWAQHHGQIPPPSILDLQGPSPGPWGPLPTPDPSLTAQRLKPHLQPGKTPSQVAWDLQGSPQALFPHLGRSPLARALLLHTRNALRSPTTRLFQHLVLGSAAFAQTYGRPAEFETPSLLERHDRPLLSAALCARLCEMRRRHLLHAAVFTARPSLPPKGSPPRPGYPPEAEMALALVGCSGLPLIGFGRLQAWLEEAGRRPESAEGWLKPHPFHALAALLAALTKDETAALNQTAAWLLDAQPPPALRSLPGLHLIALEDSTSGLQAASAAAAEVRRLGIPVEVTLVGITTHPHKRHGLREVGARTFPNCNQALEVLLRETVLRPGARG